jgi:hypothetical protein
LISSEPLAQTQGVWCAFRPGSIINIRNFILSIAISIISVESRFCFFPFIFFC